MVQLRWVWGLHGRRTLNPWMKHSTRVFLMMPSPSIRWLLEAPCSGPEGAKVGKCLVASSHYQQYKFVPCPRHRQACTSRYPAYSYNCVNSSKYYSHANAPPFKKKKRSSRRESLPIAASIRIHFVDTILDMSDNPPCPEQVGLLNPNKRRGQQVAHRRRSPALPKRVLLLKSGIRGSASSPFLLPLPISFPKIQHAKKRKKKHSR